nr:EthD domain-containing protein [Novosphingobium taihuense]
MPRTRAGLDRAGLRRHLETIHGPMVVAEPQVSGKFASYVHHYTLDCAATPALDERDAITVIRFAAIADMVASKASEAYQNRVGPDEDNFRELAGSVALFAEECEVAPGADQAEAKLFVFRDIGDFDLAAWASTLAGFATRPGVRGVVTNRARIADGVFPYEQFDEIGLDANADIPACVEALAALADTVIAPSETRHLLAEPVRFL